MWTGVLLIGVGMALDPLRLGFVAVMMSRRKPIVNLLAFWLGGVVTGVIVGIGVLVLMRDVALAAVRSAASAITEVRSAVVFLAGPRLQLTLGLLMLLLVVVITARARAAGRVPTPQPTTGGGTATLVKEDRPRNPFVWLAGRTKEMLDCDVVWPAFVVGLSSTFPPYEGVVLLAVIMASGATVGAQFCAFIIFTLLVNGLVEIPLVGYLLMPERTEAVMLRFHNWVRTYRLQITQVMFGGTGLIMLTQGLAAL
ncbi:hypothetical protein A5696_09165 [Mycobacterium sp. E2699]|uniref:GAP family protein n=1 Tax=Mycobacterium sp. E2699 TaxID=1834137 RepID=UPI0008010BB7|nr:GAP family protein [Mycobacterium sp. E2699]OBH03266.1 hypothetical protein A5696_09165 [Mycobacterium sp. E2699]